MKNWLKPTLFAFILLSGLLFLSLKLLDVRVVPASSNTIGFYPEPETTMNPLEDSLVKPRNIILFIADGMGFSHLSLAMMSQQTEGATSVWQDFTVKNWHDARSNYGPLTDSGASATAMATGTSTFFEVIGMDADGNSLENLFELAKKNNYSTGIVTDSYIWDATPAAFVAHTKSRDNAREILTQIAASDLDLIFGELEDVGEDEVPEYEETLDILTQKFQLLDESLAIPDTSVGVKPIAAIYSEDEIQDLESEPNLTELTDVALNYLSDKSEPFALLIECEEMDSASHRNDSDRVLKGLQSLQSALSVVMDFAEKNGETLVVFTSDHETGGLAVGTGSKGYPNMQMIWASRDHTAAVVPLLVYGPGAEYFRDVDRNWQLGQRLKSMVSTR